MPKFTPEHRARLLGAIMQMASEQQAREMGPRLSPSSTRHDTRVGNRAARRERAAQAAKKKKKGGGGGLDWHSALGPVAKGLEVLSLPGTAVRATLAGTAHNLGQIAHGDLSLQNLATLAASPVFAAGLTDEYGRKVLKERKGTGQILEDTSLKNLPWAAKVALGAGGDIAADPLTYVAPEAKLAGGAETVGRKLLQASEKEVAKLAAKEVAAKVAGDAGQLAVLSAAKKAVEAQGRGAAARVLEGGARKLTPEDLKLLGSRGRGTYLNVPGTGRVAKRLHLPTAKGGVQQVKVMPGAVTDKVHAPFDAVRSTLRASSRLNKLRGGAHPEIREALHSGDPERVRSAIEFKTATAHGEAMRETWAEANKQRYVREWRPNKKDAGQFVDALEGDDVAEAAVVAAGRGEKLAAAREHLSNIYEDAVKAGIDINELDHYFPRRVSEAAKAKLGFGQSSGIGGKASFEKARTMTAGRELDGMVLPETNAGIRRTVDEWAKGLGIKEGFYVKDPDKVIPRYIQAVSRRLEKQDVLHRLQEKGVVQEAYRWVATADQVSGKAKASLEFAAEKARRDAGAQGKLAESKAAEGQSVAADLAARRKEIADLEQQIAAAQANGDLRQAQILTSRRKELLAGPPPGIEGGAAQKALGAGDHYHVPPDEAMNEQWQRIAQGSGELPPDTDPRIAAIYEQQQMSFGPSSERDPLEVAQQESLDTWGEPAFEGPQRVDELPLVQPQTAEQAALDAAGGRPQQIVRRPAPQAPDTPLTFRDGPSSPGQDLAGLPKGGELDPAVVRGQGVGDTSISGPAVPEWEDARAASDLDALIADAGGAGKLGEWMRISGERMLGRPRGDVFTPKALQILDDLQRNGLRRLAPEEIRAIRGANPPFNVDELVNGINRTMGGSQTFDHDLLRLFGDPKGGAQPKVVGKGSARRVFIPDANGQPLEGMQFKTKTELRRWAREALADAEKAAKVAGEAGPKVASKGMSLKDVAASANNLLRENPSLTPEEAWAQAEQLLRPGRGGKAVAAAVAGAPEDVPQWGQAFRFGDRQTIMGGKQNLPEPAVGASPFLEGAPLKGGGNVPLPTVQGVSTPELRLKSTIRELMTRGKPVGNGFVIDPSATLVDNVAGMPNVYDEIAGVKAELNLLFERVHGQQVQDEFGKRLLPPGGNMNDLWQRYLSETPFEGATRGGGRVTGVKYEFNMQALKDDLAANAAIEGKRGGKYVQTRGLAQEAGAPGAPQVQGVSPTGEATRYAGQVPQGATSPEAQAIRARPAATGPTAQGTHFPEGRPVWDPELRRAFTPGTPEADAALAKQEALRAAPESPEGDLVPPSVPEAPPTVEDVVKGAADQEARRKLLREHNRVYDGRWRREDIIPGDNAANVEGVGRYLEEVRKLAKAAHKVNPEAAKEVNVWLDDARKFLEQGDFGTAKGYIENALSKVHDIAFGGGIYHRGDAFSDAIEAGVPFDEFRNWVKEDFTDTTRSLGPPVEAGVPTGHVPQGPHELRSLWEQAKQAEATGDWSQVSRADEQTLGEAGLMTGEGIVLPWHEAAGATGPSIEQNTAYLRALAAQIDDPQRQAIVSRFADMMDADQGGRYSTVAARQKALDRLGSENAPHMGDSQWSQYEVAARQAQDALDATQAEGWGASFEGTNNPFPMGQTDWQSPVSGEIYDAQLKELQAATEGPGRALERYRGGPPAIREIARTPAERAHFELLDSTQAKAVNMADDQKAIEAGYQEAQQHVAEAEALANDATAPPKVRMTAQTQADLLRRHADLLQRMGAEEDPMLRRIASLEAESLKAKAAAEELLTKADAQTLSASGMVTTKKLKVLTDAYKNAMFDSLDGYPNLVAQPDVAEALNKTYKILTPTDMQGFLQHYDTVLNYIKAWQVATPGFHLRNYLGGIFNNWLSDIDPGAYRRWHRVKMFVEKGRGQATQVEQDAYNALKGFVGRGQFSTHEFETGLSQDNLLNRSLNVFSSKHAIPHTSQRVGGFVEEYLRGAQGLDVMAKGGTLDDAIETINKFHFDYEDLSGVEKQVVKRVIPFYTWTRKNFPLQIEMMLKRPGKYMAYYHVKDNIEKNTPITGNVVPQYFGDLGAIPMPFGAPGGGGQMFLSPDLPFTQSMTQPLPVDTNGIDLNRPMSMVTPLIKTPLERFKSEQFFKDIPLKDTWDAAPPSWQHIPGLMEVMGALGKAKKTDKGWAMKQRDAYTIESFMPLLGRMRRQVPGDDKKAQDRVLSSWMSFVGVPLRTNTKLEQKNELLRRKFSKMHEITIHVPNTPKKKRKHKTVSTSGFSSSEGWTG